MSDDVYLVTGSMGCIGAWVLKHLTGRGEKVVATDLATDPVRPRLLMTEEQLAGIDWQTLDVTDTEAVKRLVDSEGVTRIVHLAGLQIPFCRANPPLGAAVNVLGTVNILEAARSAGVKGISYASSLAVLGQADHYPDLPVPDNAPRLPHSLYGVYKVANEETARIYAADWGVGSVGLRPQCVYGIGRDQGVTADFAKAILAATIGRPFHIRFGGLIALQHASDVAHAFVACADAEASEAHVFNQRYDVVQVADFAATISALIPDAEITWETDAEFPFPSDLDDSGLRGFLGDLRHTPLRDAVAFDIERFRELVSEDRVDLSQLDA